MDAPLPTTLLRCTQCGGELHPDEGQLFVTCPFCSTTVYLDKARVVFHWYLAPTIDDGKARGLLAQWMAGNETVKDLDKKSHIAGQAFEYFPVWYFKRRKGEKDEVVLETAAATSVSELKKLHLPAGDLRRYDPALGSQAHPPTVPLETALGWLKERGVPQAEIAESALVHIPLYTFKYQFNGQTYTALVEAATGRTLANIFPAKAEAPYILAGCAAAAVYLFLALIPIVGYFVQEGGEGFFGGLAVCAGLGCLAAPVLFGLAAWVAAKV
jgi:predicted RNA-binding Zn-ribbon protein involved in translation (DUF1610 family)